MICKIPGERLPIIEVIDKRGEAAHLQMTWRHTRARRSSTFSTETVLPSAGHYGLANRWLPRRSVFAICEPDESEVWLRPGIRACQSYLGREVKELVNGPYLEKSQVYKEGAALERLSLHEKTKATIRKRLGDRAL
jgi:hypothetical protein